MSSPPPAETPNLDVLADVNIFPVEYRADAVLPEFQRLEEGSQAYEYFNNYDEDDPYEHKNFKYYPVLNLTEK